MADDTDFEAMLEVRQKKTCLAISHLYSREFTFDASVNCQKDEKKVSSANGHKEHSPKVLCVKI